MTPLPGASMSPSATEPQYGHEGVLGSQRWPEARQCCTTSRWSRSASQNGALSWSMPGAIMSAPLEAGRPLLHERLQAFGCVMRCEAVVRVAFELEPQAGVDAAVVGPQRVHHLLRVGDRE